MVARFLRDLHLACPFIDIAQRPLSAAMKQVTHELTMQQIKALAAFVQSFAGPA